MEIQINSDFIQSFVSKYQENAAKAIKYLAVVGIHFLETVNKQDMPFKELQELAKSFSQPKPPTETPYNKELQVIKDELIQLSKKIEGRIGSPEQVTKAPLKKANEGIPPKNAKNANANAGTKVEPKGLAQKPPTAKKEVDQKERAKARNTERSEQIETNYDSVPREQPRSRVSPANRSVERREASVGSSKGDYITPKPTEIVLPTVDPKESKNRVTKHHLDGSEAKRAMNEEGVIFFPKAEKEEVPKTVTKEPRKEQPFVLGESPFFGRERPTQQPEDSYNAEWSDVAESPGLSQFSKARFPQTSQAREIVATKLFSNATMQENKENYRQLQNRPETRQSRELPPQLEYPKKNQNQTRPSPVDVPPKRNSSKSRNESSQLGSSKQSTGYRNVSSKIKDEVNYHKELSKQYKRMKQSMTQSEGFSDDFILSNSTRFDLVSQERPRNLDMETAAWGRSPYQSEEVAQTRTPKLMESDSTIRSSLTMQQLSAANVDNRRPVENTRPQNRFEDLERSEDENLYRSQAGNRGGGMLDIANSFLNSPLMQHITNTEKNYDTSFRDSMAYSIQNRNPRFTNYASNQDFGESNAYGQSRSGNFGTEEDMKLQSSYGLQQSKYSNAGNNAYNSERVGRPNLKDSTNRRFQENMNNELAASYNKEGVSSLASSNFSNFLNDEMKGFYQKERLDLKKPKNSDSIMRFGSSVNSENTSFHMGTEPPVNYSKVEKKSQFYKNEYGDNLDNTNNKTFDGFSFDNANVFKDERMSVTQILNN